MQLRYSGMCAVVELMQKGFPTRCTFQDIHQRYMLCDLCVCMYVCVCVCVCEREKKVKQRVWPCVVHMMFASKQHA